MVGRNRWTFRFSTQLQGLQRHRGNKSVGSLNGWQVLFSIRRQLRCPRKARLDGWRWRGCGRGGAFGGGCWVFPESWEVSWRLDCGYLCSVSPPKKDGSYMLGGGIWFWNTWLPSCHHPNPSFVWYKWVSERFCLLIVKNLSTVNPVLCHLVRLSDPGM